MDVQSSVLEIGIIVYLQTPQIILLTFDGAVNLNNYEHYKKVFNKQRKNPNGCEIKGTFFISHEYSNYQMIQQLASEGHEIATETISWVRCASKDFFSDKLIFQVATGSSR